MDNLPSWEDVLSSAARLQEIVAKAVLVGGTAAALFANHRVSYDADHVVADLREHFDQVLADLESVAGWTTERIRRPVLILGSLDGVETGIRQLIRTQPLETEELELLPGERRITVPTLPEMLRIKAALVLQRNATRDYVDMIAISTKLKTDGVVSALATFDALYPQPNGASPLRQLFTQLSDPHPFDFDSLDDQTVARLLGTTTKAQFLKSCTLLASILFNAIPTELPEHKKRPDPMPALFRGKERNYPDKTGQENKRGTPSR
jgi:hypothetical protein